MKPDSFSINEAHIVDAGPVGVCKNWLWTCEGLLWLGPYWNKFNISKSIPRLALQSL